MDWEHRERAGLQGVRGPVGLPSALACCQSAHMVASHLGGWCSQGERAAEPNPGSGRTVWGRFKNLLSILNYKISSILRSGVL